MNTIVRRLMLLALAILALGAFAAAGAGAAARVRVQVLGARALSSGVPLRLVATRLVPHARYRLVLNAASPAGGSCARALVRVTPAADAVGRLSVAIAAPKGGWCPASSYTGRLVRVGLVRPVASFGFRVLAAPSGTLSGTVIVISPCVGVPHSANVCAPPRPLAGASLRIMGAGGQTVARVSSDQAGQFGAHLAPGTYVLVPGPMGSLRAPAPQRLTIAAGRPLTGLTVRYALTGGSPKG